MSTRKYQMDRRAEASAQTRKRIVEATFALHYEKGVAATTFRDISARADVGIGTVYHHFPTYDDVIAACGNHAMTLGRPPRAEIFDGIDSAAERVRLLVREVFAYYGRARSSVGCGRSGISSPYSKEPSITKRRIAGP